MNKDYYKILGVSKDSSEIEIKKAFKRLALKYHPDKNSDSGAEDKFKEINEAYSVVGNSNKRQSYDFKSNRLGGEGFNSMFEGFDFGIDFGAEFFGSRGNVRSDPFAGFRANTGVRHETVLIPVTLENVVTGVSRMVSSSQGTIDFNVPKGVRNNQSIVILSNSTNIVRAKFVYVDHDKFKVLKEFDLSYTTYINIYDLVLGGDIILNTIDGDITVKLKENNYNGKVIRVKNKGLPIFENPGMRGNLYVTLFAKLPESISDKERELFMELKKIQIDGRN